MSKKGSKTAADSLDWNYAVDIIGKLYDDGEIVLSLFMATMINLGLKPKEIRDFRWNYLLTINEIERNGVKIVVADEFNNFVRRCYKKLKIKNPYEHCFLSQKKTVISIQWFNRLLKDIKIKYDIEIENFSTLSFRKTFALKFVDSCSDCYLGFMALQKFFNYANINELCKSLNIKIKKEIKQVKIKEFNVSLKKDDIEDEVFLEELKEIKNDVGYCYIMKDDLYPMYYKIGKAKNPTIREKTLLHDSPTISLFKAVKTESMSKLESELHNIFEDKRYRGEWFKLTEKDINWLIETYGFCDYTEKINKKSVNYDEMEYVLTSQNEK
jgi:hypothetical protein